MKKQLLTAIVSAGILFTINNGQASAHELTYKVHSGDTLWKISEWNHIPIADLMKWNNLKSTSIQVGQELTLLAPHSHESYKSYTVKSGDSLFLIAKNYHTTISQLKSINHLSSNSIYIGQVIKVPVQAGTSASLSTYTVKSGDSLYTIAKNHGMTISALKSINGLTSDSIWVGQVLKVKAGTVSSQTATTYTVKSGDSLWSIATRYRLTVANLRAFNHLTSNNIYVGQVLRLKAPVYISSSRVTPFQADALIADAKRFIGVPYVWAGTTPSGFDCSGFLDYVYKTQNITLPRTVEAIWNQSKTVSTPQKGDIVFFETYTNGPSHAGIYIGNNQFIHASSSQGVTISSLSNVYWKPRYLGAKRVY